MIVVDASAALSWALSDEHTPESLAQFQRIVDTGETLIAPSIWPLEVSNVVHVKASRRKQIDNQEAATALALLRALPVQFDPVVSDRVWNATYQLARAYDLTTYDAAYLELADRLGVPLATIDDKLISAAKTCGVIIYG